MIITICSYYVKNDLVQCGESLDEKDMADFLLKNNITQFLTNIPVYDGLEEYGISVESIRSYSDNPNKNEYFNYISNYNKLNVK